MSDPQRPNEQFKGLWISDMAIRQPVFITMVMLAVVTFGLLSFRTLPVNLLPDIDIPVMSVSLRYPGAGPESVADQVVRPLEDSVNTIAGLRDLTSQANDGLAILILEFEAGTDIAKADQDVREKINAVMPALPRDVRQPVFQRFDPNQDPIMSVAVAGTAGQSPLELRQVLDNEIVPLLQRARGVGNIDVDGGELRQINVLMDLQKLQAYGILPVQLTNSLRQANANLGLGSIVQGSTDISLRAPSLLQTPEDIANIQITGTPYRIGDVATIEDGAAERMSYARLDGSDAIILSIRKQSGANTVTVADNVHAAMVEVFANRPELTYTIARDDSEFVRASISSSLEELVFASIAAFLVVWFFFRNLRSTIITMAGLPVILIGTFIFMPVFDLSVNLITLLALSLCVGLVIDDAIVVRENIFRHMERGASARIAASKGTWEVALSVVAMTLTIVAVFVPVTFAEGTAGIVFRSFGLVIAVAILLSLLEAFVLAPMLSGNVFPGTNLKKEHKPHASVDQALPDLKLEHIAGANAERDASLIQEAQEDPGRLGRAYGKLLAWTLASTRNRLTVIGIALGVMVVSLFVASTLKFSFFPEQDPHEFLMGFEAAPGTTLAETNRLAARAEEILLADPAVETVIATVGYSGNPERTQFFVKLVARTPTLEVQERLREQLLFLPRLAFALPSFQPTSTGVAGRELLVSVQSTRPTNELGPVVDAIKGQMATMQGLVDIDTNFQTGRPELRFIADPGRIGELGVTNDDIANSVRALISGDVATAMRQDGVDTDIVVRLRESDRSGIEALNAISIPTNAGNVPLSALGRIEIGDSPVTIRRYNRLNEVLVGANLQNRNLGEAQEELNMRIAALGIPNDVVIEYTGIMEQTTEGFDSLFLAMALSVLFVYMVLASQFGSFTQPLVIMMAMPFSFIGAFLALRILNVDLDITGMIGLILLLGLVVKNSILLVDFTNRIRDLGLNKHDALRLAGAIRLRPILMTALSLIAGAMPTAIGLHVFGTGQGTEFRSGLAWVIIGGMTTSTLLTLLVVPTVYSLMDSVATRTTNWAVRRFPSLIAIPEAAPVLSDSQPPTSSPSTTQANAPSPASQQPAPSHNRPISSEPTAD
ncbi:efflux RND transporter permease subunit [Candidatus Viridilinea mediisalina]|uniref:Acriflavin resistance protein n=1 Tax=Candidatus Viridilinea mediisalina TaxID=2024553 RepID=A0A2A6RKT1_9CHLR|nr:efflux RND transporter permease subunit [Candidatus Viridilinea mediisalina]PDW03505.1 acriflavin resistance protein [Candidatus Viridilinea mediisalina]